MGHTTSSLLYLITIICFVLALRFLSSPRTARRGNLVGAAGMAVAIAVTLAQPGVAINWEIIVGAAIGTAFGAVGARRVKMTAMPQMVALFNGVGGGAAALVSIAEFHLLVPGARQPAPRRLARDRALGADRVDLVLRLDGRVREAAGTALRPADHLSRPADRQPRPVRRADRRRDRDRRRLRAAMGARGDGARRARLRRPVRAADRRGGHAGRDLAAERLHRPRGGGDGLRARLERPDRQRRPRRRLGDAAHDDDGQGDEPVARERALRRVRAGAGGRRVPRPR